MMRGFFVLALCLFVPGGVSVAEMPRGQRVLLPGELPEPAVVFRSSTRTTVGPWPHRYYWGKGLTTLGDNTTVYAQDVTDLEKAVEAVGNRKVGELSSTERDRVAREILKAARGNASGFGANAKELGLTHDYRFLRQ
ncbi:hypothetical protein [Planctomicrobium sp. SH664]|uniref:hypothetical protein n=1 Tax=Planctomicrobium sp. SH664 TaxID=3448125 RepID=UPI003F5C3746